MVVLVRLDWRVVVGLVVVVVVVVLRFGMVRGGARVEYVWKEEEGI